MLVDWVFSREETGHGTRRFEYFDDLSRSSLTRQLLISLEGSPPGRKSAEEGSRQGKHPLCLEEGDVRRKEVVSK